MKPYEQLKQEHLKRNMRQMVTVTKIESDLVKNTLCLKSLENYVDESKTDLQWFTRVLTVDNEISAVVSEIEIQDLLTRNKLN